MPETPFKFAASILKNDGTNTPLREYSFTEGYDPQNDTHFYICYIESVPSMKFGICVKSRDPHQSRMGAIVYVDDVEQNRVGLRAGFAVQLTGRPLSGNTEVPFEFKTQNNGSGSIKIELWRSIVVGVSEGAVTYGNPGGDNPAEAIQPVANATTQVSKVQYLDKQPRIVFIFEYRSKAEIAGMNLLKMIPMPTSVPSANTSQSSIAGAPVVKLASHPEPITLSLPNAKPSFHEPILAEDTIRRVLIQAIDHPDTARALIEACVRKHGISVMKTKDGKK